MKRNESFKRDLKELELIYEKSKSYSTDFLIKECTDNFNWDNFWQNYMFCEQNYYPLYESFEKIRETNSSDEYKVVASNGMEFEVMINYHPKTVLDNYLMNAFVSNPNDRNKLKQIKDTVEKTQNPILNVNFRDDANNFHTTNKLGNYSFSVISGVKKSIADSLYNRGNIAPDILYFLVKKGEDKKVEFFQNVFKGLFGKLNDKYIDFNYSPQYNALYFFKNPL